MYRGYVTPSVCACVCVSACVCAYMHMCACMFLTHMHLTVTALILVFCFSLMSTDQNGLRSQHISLICASPSSTSPFFSHFFLPDHVWGSIADCKTFWGKQCMWFWVLNKIYLIYNHIGVVFPIHVNSNNTHRKGCSMLVSLQQDVIKIWIQLGLTDNIFVICIIK